MHQGLSLNFRNLSPEHRVWDSLVVMSRAILVFLCQVTNKYAALLRKHGLLDLSYHVTNKDEFMLVSFSVVLCLWIFPLSQFYQCADYWFTSLIFFLSFELYRLYIQISFVACSWHFLFHIYNIFVVCLSLLFDLFWFYPVLVCVGSVAFIVSENIF